MADFAPAFDRMIVAEGGYRLHTIPGDRGGMTYAGIARTRNPQWPGWALVDRGITASAELSAMVREFYRANYWAAVRGDDLRSQAIAASLFDFAVNAGVGVAVKLAQVVVGAVPDGAIGPVTLDKLNAIADHEFTNRYALAKVARYAEICNRDREQSKFLLGWINRTLQGAA